MGRKSGLKFDRIGYWSEMKLSIIKEYAAAHSTIFRAERQHGLYHVYVDAFAGPGMHISKRTGEPVPGSPLNALQVEPRFREYHFIELDRLKVAALKQAVGRRPEVHVHDGDCNNILLKKVFPKVRFEDFPEACVCSTRTVCISTGGLSRRLAG